MRQKEEKINPLASRLFKKIQRLENKINKLIRKRDVRLVLMNDVTSEQPSENPKNI